MHRRGIQAWPTLTCRLDRRHPLAHGLVGWWKVLPDARGDWWYDLSGYRNHATLTNVTPTNAWVATERGTACKLAANNQHAFLPRAISWLDSEGEPTSFPITVTLWFKADANVAKGLFSIVAGSTYYGFRCALGGSVATAIRSAGTERQATSATTYTAGKWHFYSATLDRALAVCYLDCVPGTPDTTLFAPVGMSETNIGRIGGAWYQYGWDQPFAGMLDDVRVYNRILSDAELRLAREDSASGRYAMLIRSRSRRYWRVSSGNQYTIDVSGSLRCGGTVPASVARLANASGVVQAGGQSLPAWAKNETSQAGVLLSGISSLSQVATAKAEGRITVSGEARVAVQTTAFPAGTLRLGGTAPGGYFFAMAMGGGVALAGESLARVDCQHASDGGLVLTAIAATTGVFVASSSGQLTLDGEVTPTGRRIYFEHGTGSLAVAGASPAVTALLPAPTGGVVLQGASPSFRVYEETPAGGLATAGSSAARTSSQLAAALNVQISDAVGISIVSTIAPSGKLTTRGQSPVLARCLVTPSGRLTLGGETHVGRFYVVDSAGTFQIAGHSEPSFTFQATTAGYLELSGQVGASGVYSLRPTGKLAVSSQSRPGAIYTLVAAPVQLQLTGVATPSVNHPTTIVRGIFLASSSVPQVAFAPSVSGILETTGRAVPYAAYPLNATGQLVVAAALSPRGKFHAMATGTIDLGSGTVVVGVYQPRKIGGQIRAGGAAPGTVARGVVSSGQIALASRVKPRQVSILAVSGSLALAGDARLVSRCRVSADGVVALYGNSDVVVQRAPIAGGALHLADRPTVAADHVANTSGYLAMTGHARASATRSELAARGMLIDGDSLPNAAYAPSPLGGMRTAGTAGVRSDSIVVVAGGLRLAASPVVIVTISSLIGFVGGVGRVRPAIGGLARFRTAVGGRMEIAA